jgi:hypothetical protein
VQIQPDTAYQKQQETLIVWSEGDNFDLALSFQVGLDPGFSTAGCEGGGGGDGERDSRACCEGVTERGT